MEACVGQQWQTHKQGACQFAASVDAARLSYGVADWIGMWDVDEFIYPSEEVGDPNLPDLFEKEWPMADYIVLCGSVFGTNGHKVAPAPKRFDAIAPLVTEHYIRRRALDNHEESPFASALERFDKVANVSGDLAQQFTRPETFARKSFVRPTMAGWGVVHDWIQLPSMKEPLERVDVWITHDKLKMNHYAYLSEADAEKKATENGNPLAAYNPEQDAFYSAEEDAGIWYLLELLKFRMANSIIRQPPSFRDVDIPSKSASSSFWTMLVGHF